MKKNVFSLTEKCVKENMIYFFFTSNGRSVGETVQREIEQGNRDLFALYMNPDFVQFVLTVLNSDSERIRTSQTYAHFASVCEANNISLVGEDHTDVYQPLRRKFFARRCCA